MLALCATPAEVAEAIAVARRRGLTTSTRSGGHCFAGYSSDGEMIIDVSPMNAISVAGDVATIGAGARLGVIYQTLAARHRTIAAGCGDTVGISGLTLGGGLGLLGRRHGLTCDQLLSARVVLADGRVTGCDQEHEPGLFWALRGAGPSFPGVVTELTFRTVPAPVMTGFHLAWPPAFAASVIEAWQAWAPAAPPELAASLLVTTRAVNVSGTGSAVVHPLGELAARAGGHPARTVTEPMPYLALKRYFTELGDQMRQPAAPAAQAPEVIKSEFFARPLPGEAIAELVAAFHAGQAGELDFTPWGGAYSRPAPGATAFAHRDARFLLKHVGQPDRTWAVTHPFGTGGAYQNFPDPGLADAGHAYYGGNLSRLLRVRKRYDPDGFFRLRT